MQKGHAEALLKMASAQLQTESARSARRRRDQSLGKYRLRRQLTSAPIVQIDALSAGAGLSLGKSPDIVGSRN